MHHKYVVAIFEVWPVLVRTEWFCHKYVVAILRRLASFGVKRMDAPQICCCNFAKVDVLL